MQLWLDTTDLETIKTALKLGHLTGVTTNPSLLSKSELPPEKLIDQILSLDDRLQLALQVTADDESGMLQQARRFASSNCNLVIKVPVTQKGLSMMPILVAEGIPVMATAVFTPHQVILASLANASYIAVYFSRLGDNSEEMVGKMQEMLVKTASRSQLLGASIKSKDHIIKLINQGVSVITLSESVYQDFIKNDPLTLQCLKQFETDWNANPQTANNPFFNYF